MYERAEINKFLRTYKSSGSLQKTARDFAEFAHNGQLDKAGNPFFSHVERVTENLSNDGYDESILTIGWLHDIIDDGGFTLSDLQMFFPESIWKGVYHLSHNKTLSREDYLDQIAENKNAIIVKIADINDNMMITRKPIMNDKEYQRTIKYNHEIEWLNAKL